MTPIEYLLSCLQLYKFLIELLIFCVLFVLPLPRRNRFNLRLIVSLLVCFLLSSYWNRQMAQIMALAIVRYLVLFLSVVAAIWFCFKCSAPIALFCGMGGYAAQHLFFKLYQIVDALTGKKTFWPQIWLTIAVLAAVLLGVWFLFAKHIERSNYQSMANKKNLILCGFVLLCAIVFSAFCTAYSGTSGSEILIVCYLYDCVCCVMALWIQLGLFRLDRMKQEMMVVQQLWYQEKKHLAASQENIDLINIKCHDMKHLISQIIAQGGQATEGELRDIQKLINIYDFSVNTGNDILNLILAEKSLVCQKSGIRLNCVADGGKLCFMSDSDIYSLFGNALDNAIAAVQALQNEEKRIITLTIKSALGMLSICIENYYDGDLSFEDDLPVTGNSDRDYHGYGMKSMRYLVQKYGGELDISAADGVFTVNMLFPCE